MVVDQVNNKDNNKELAGDEQEAGVVDRTPWVIKHSPKKLSAVVGNHRAKGAVWAYLTRFKRGDKPLLIYGPPGVGKSSSVHAAAKELGFEVVEVNASDKRNKKSVTELLGAVLGQQSLFFNSKVIFLDEVDGLSGNQDRGGAAAIAKLVLNSSFPVIMSANDGFSDKLKGIRKIAKVVEFSPLSVEEVVEGLKIVADAEGVVINDRLLKAIARRSAGDFRGAVNDLQSIVSSHGKDLGNASPGIVEELGFREREEGVKSALSRVFMSSKAEIALGSFDNVSENLDELFSWFEENLGRVYSFDRDVLARAYYWLAEADRFYGRIRRWQYYRFYVYIYYFLTAGIATAKNEPLRRLPLLNKSRKALTIWIYNNKNAKKRSIAEKIAAKTHTSTKRALDNLPFLIPLLADEDSSSIRESLGLDSAESSWLKKR